MVEGVAEMIEHSVGGALIDLCDWQAWARGSVVWEVSYGSLYFVKRDRLGDG